VETQEWEKRHIDAFYSVKQTIPYLEGMFVAYNCNIDAIKHLTEADVARLIGLFNEAEIQERIEEYPREIKDPLDFMARLIISMREGKAAEIPNHNSDIHEWLKNHLGFDYARMGGQAGIISNELACLGLRKVVSYVPWLSKEQAEYYEKTDNLWHPKVEDGKVVLKHPQEAFKPNMGSKVNWIIEYSKGLQVNSNNRSFIVQRDNRLIISSRPTWLRLDMDKEVYEQLDAIFPIDGAMLSGYQVIKEEYEDGTNYKQYVERSVQVIEKLKSLNPELRIHVELTSIQNRVIRKTILADIVAKHVHSLGLDTVEVANALNVLGHEELSYSVIKKEENGITALYQGAVQLLKDLSLERVHVHSLGFYICVLEKDHLLSLKDHRDFLLFSSTLAAAKAFNGTIGNLDEAQIGLKVPISGSGIRGLEEFKAYCVSRKLCNEEEFDYGYLYGPDHDAIIVPSKIVEKPKATVGIGDAISAAAFSAMLARMKQKKATTAPK
jgi:ADP-dependent phosphofructokinase/glucokinase